MINSAWLPPAAIFMPLLFFRHSSGWHRQHLVLDPQEKRTPIWSSECVMNLNPFWSMSANTGRKVRPWPLCLQQAKPLHFFSSKNLIQIWGGLLCLCFPSSRFYDSIFLHFPSGKRASPETLHLFPLHIICFAIWLDWNWQHLKSLSSSTFIQAHLSIFACRWFN